MRKVKGVKLLPNILDVRRHRCSNTLQTRIKWQARLEVSFNEETDEELKNTNNNNWTSVQNGNPKVGNVNEDLHYLSKIHYKSKKMKHHAGGVMEQ